MKLKELIEKLKENTMNIDKEVNMQLFMQQQEQSRHLDYEKEFGIYKAIAQGNMEEVKLRHKDYEDQNHYSKGDNRNGVLSADPVQNAKYHYVILAAMVSRFCAQYGLPREVAYSMSDIFIQRVDVCKKLEEIDALQTEMIMSYTKAMQENRSKGIYSKQIVKCVDYIHANLQQELRLETIAEYLNMNPTYLSRLFKKEMNISISAYIKHERLKSAAYLLEYSNYSISEISEYLNFSSQSHFTSSFQELYGLTPKRYRDLHTNCESPDYNSDEINRK